MPFDIFWRCPWNFCDAAGLQRASSAPNVSHLMRTAGLAIAVATAALLAQPPVSKAQDLTKLKILQSFTTDGSAAPYIYAKQTGLFRRAGFDVTIDPSGGSGDVLTRVAAGTYDAGVSDMGTVIQFSATNPEAAPRAVFGIQDTAQYTLMTFKRYGITKPTDIAGKRLGGALGDATMILFPLLAKAVGLDLSRVEFKRGEVRLREALFLRGEYEVVAGFDSTLWFNVRSQGVKLEDLVFMNYSDYGLDLFGQMLVVSREFLGRNPEGVRKLVCVVNEAWREAIKDPKRVAAVLPSVDPMIRLDLETERLEWIIKYHVATPRVRKNGISNVDFQRLQSQI